MAQGKSPELGDVACAQVVASSQAVPTPCSSPRFRPNRRIILVAVAVGLALIVVVVLLQILGGDDGLGLVKPDASSSYPGVTLLVFLDAICPVFPGETTLNAASTLAAQGTLELGWVIVAGAVGAIAGDSALYWASRLFSRRLQKQVERARQNDKVAGALALLGNSAPLLLTAGRFVPGVRFVVNATLGIERFPYPRFLLWSGIGGALWSIYTCALAYAVGTALANFPLASVVISGTITTVLMGVIFWRVRRNRRAARTDRRADVSSADLRT
jgi:membrane protein DedA with SNARE-associated domain